jgi:tRNA-2-methylthio-N6-dimethylallyladenosine synthase
LVRESRFKNSFIFKYSERPGTKGAEMYEDDVPDEVKRRRNNELLAIQNQISEQDNQAFLGQRVEVLVEGQSKASAKQNPTDGATGPTQLMGRTHCDRIVVFDGNPRLIGEFVSILIYDANCHTLFGQVETYEVGPELFTLGVPNRFAGNIPAE